MTKKYCKGDPSRIYTGEEPSPKGFGFCAHNQKLNSMKKGKDGNFWQVRKTRKGTFRWFKMANSNKPKEGRNTKHKRLSKKSKTVSRIERKISRSKENNTLKDDIHNNHSYSFKDYKKLKKSRRKPSVKQQVEINSKNNNISSKKININQTSLSNSSKIYNTSYNGGYCFRVIVKPPFIYVEGYNNKIKPPIKFIPEEIFLGVDLHVNYIKSNEELKENLGNTILIKIKPLQYVYIGEQIFKFKTVEPIKQYYSVVANSGVPYPIGISDKYIYSLLDKTYLPYSIYEKNKRSHLLKDKHIGVSGYDLFHFVLTPNEKKDFVKKINQIK